MVPGTVLPDSLQHAQVNQVEPVQSPIVALPEYTPADLCVLQQADPVIKEALVFWWRGNRPNGEEQKAVSQPALALLHQWDRLMERDGVLYRQAFRPDGLEAVCQLILPASLREEVLTKVHQDHGHQGVERTL